MSSVCLARCPDYDEDTCMTALLECLGHLGGIEKFVSPGNKVAIKVNLLMKKHPDAAVTTHPALVKAMGKLIKKAGGTVTIVDSPGSRYTEASLRAIYGCTGMERIATEEGFTLNFDLSSKEIDNPLGKILKKVTVIQPLIDADVIINMPKMKSHGQMVFTGGVKNMFGAIPGAYKAEYHLRMPDYATFADALIDIFLSLGPQLTIMDAVMAMDGDGPAGGDPKKVGLILGSENAFELDMTALTIAGARPLDIPIVKQGAARGLCPESIERVTLLGESLDAVKVPDFRLPALKSPVVVQWVSRGILRSLLGSLRPRPEFDHRICIGCGECERNCPARVITMKDKRPHADLSGCIRCFCCQELCPEKAVIIRRPFLARLILR
jgi:uncharacterized protein (DUF362 family)/NAD-dependent dihydropyrimidine dehydrogenase PreA subunit